MTQSEFRNWIEFYKLNPFDDLHRYHRPAALQVWSNGGDIEKSLDWLMPEKYSGDFTDADLSVLKAFGK